MQFEPAPDWPPGFSRIPSEPWAARVADPRGLRYDAMKTHRWYTNLDVTVEQVAESAPVGAVLVDYSGGTGILAERLLARRRDIAVAIVDSSSSFLSAAVSKLGVDARVAFRQIHAKNGRLESLDEAAPELAGLIDGLVSTNAVHLYDHLPETFTGWRRAMRPGAPVYVQSAAILNPHARAGDWLLTEVVGAMRERARVIVETDERYRAYRPTLEDRRRMAAYNELWNRIFLPTRPLSEYEAALVAAGFRVSEIEARSVEVGVAEWFEAATVYPDILAWVGGSEKVDSQAPSAEALADRAELMRRGMAELFPGQETFSACWTYLTAHADGPA